MGIKAAADVGAISRRVALSGLAATGLGFAVFGPRGGPRPPAGRKVLTYWEKWTGHEGEAMRAVVDAFNASQDRLFVRYVTVSTIHQKAMIAIAGGDPPDVVGLYAFNVPAYAEADAVLPLDDLAPAQGVRLDQYASGMRRVMTHGLGSPSRQRWYAAVNTAGTLALYYNRSIFRECGLNADEPPRTVTELDRAHAAITRVGGDGAIERAGFLHAEPGWWSWIWGYHFGGSLYDAATDRATADDPRNVAAYRWLQSYPRTMGARAVETFQKGLGFYGQPQASFLTGQVAMQVQGPWMANLIKAFRPDLDYGVTPVPVADEILDEGSPVALIDTDVLMIPRGAKDPEASMEFVAFTQRREQVEFLATAHCKGSPLLDVSDAFLSGHPNRGVRLHTALASSPRAFTPPATKVWPEYKDLFDSTVFSMWALRREASEALGTVTVRGQEMLDEAARLRRVRGEVALGHRPVGGTGVPPVHSARGPFGYPGSAARGAPGRTGGTPVPPAPAPPEHRA